MAFAAAGVAVAAAAVREHERRLAWGGRCRRVAVQRPRRARLAAVEEPLTGEAAEDAALEARAHKVDYYLRRYEYEQFQKIPKNIFLLAIRNFNSQLGAMISELLVLLGLKYEDQPDGLPECIGLKLSNERVRLREQTREDSGVAAETSGIVRFGYEIICNWLDYFFEDRPIPRFYFLETVARMPYFSYTSVLHLYETIGWVRDPEIQSIHIAEEWNEQHHLLIMESLGGSNRWFDRFIAQHASLAYYWVLVALFMLWPSESYRFSELLESHAVDTYTEFLETNKKSLESLPVPEVAEFYYKTGPRFMFDEFNVSLDPGTRQPPVDNLFQVFEAIRDDEMEHVLTMTACQEYVLNGKRVRSPHFRDALGETEPGDARQQVRQSMNEERRELWDAWARKVNAVEQSKDS